MNHSALHCWIAAALLLAGVALAAAPPAAAQVGGTRVSFGFSAAPTVNWLSDAEVRLRALQENPETVNADSLVALFSGDTPPAQIGFKAGLSMTVSRRWAGLRLGVNVLNAGGVVNGAGGLDEEKLRDNFVTFLVDLQLRRRAGPATFYVFGGPEFRYRLDLTDEETITARSFRDNMEPLSATATFGAGVYLGVGGLRVAPEVRYAYDLSGVSGQTFEADGHVFKLSDEFRLNTFVFGLVFGGV